MDKILQGLNPAQRQAVETTEGPLLLLAGAGSGKTRVITHRIQYLIEAKGISPEAILAVTFTNKAAQEMRERVRSMVGTKKNGLTVSTFHALGAAILRKYIHHLGYKRNFGICSEADRQAYLRQSLLQFPASERPEIKQLSGRISRLKNAVQQADIVDAEDTLLKSIAASYQKKLLVNNVVDFDDLLLLPLTLFEQHPDVLAELRNRFRYLMVDEYQDTNRIQYTLIKQLAESSRNLCVVGDDDQSIYTWRGADSRNISEFEQDWPEGVVIKLEQNYRCTPVILAAANAVIAQNKDRRSKNLWTKATDSEKIVQFMAETPEAEAEEVINYVRRLQFKADLRYGEMAVLFRRNTQSRVLESALRIAQIPYKLVGGIQFFERKEVKELFKYMQLIANPQDDISYKEAIMIPRRGIGQQTFGLVEEAALQNGKSVIDFIRTESKPTALQSAKWEILQTFTENIFAFNNRSKSEKPSLLLERVIAAIDYIGHIQQTAKDKDDLGRRKQVMNDLLQSLRRYEEKTSNPSLQHYLERIALLSREDRREGPDSGQLTLMTIHAAKGLEFPAVFVIGMEENIFPSQQALAELRIEEERRLFYVAVTRAKKRLFLSAVKKRRKYGKEEMNPLSRFLAEIPASLIEIKGAAKSTEDASDKDAEVAAKAFFQLKKKLQNK
jgi:DNA helicase-2/ATP-dependent DNA helicase PcrA